MKQFDLMWDFILLIPFCKCIALWCWWFKEIDSIFVVIIECGLTQNHFIVLFFLLSTLCRARKISLRNCIAFWIEEKLQKMKWNETLKSNAMEIAHHYLHESEHICIYTKPLKQLDAWVKHEIFNRRLTFLAKYFTHASRKEIKKQKEKTHINRNHNLLHSIVLWVCTNSLINFKCYQLKWWGSAHGNCMKRVCSIDRLMDRWIDGWMKVPCIECFVASG